MEPLDIAKELLQDPSKMEDLCESDLKKLKVDPGTNSAGGMSSFEESRLRNEANVLRERLTSAEQAGTALMSKVEELEDDKLRASGRVEEFRERMKSKDREMQAMRVVEFKKNKELNYVRAEYNKLNAQSEMFEMLENLKNCNESQSIEDVLLGRPEEDQIQILRTKLTYYMREYNVVLSSQKTDHERHDQNLNEKSNLIKELTADLKCRREDMHEMKQKNRKYLKHLKTLKAENEQLKILGPDAQLADRRMSMASTTSEAPQEPATPALFKVHPQPAQEAAVSSSSSSQRTGGSRSLFAAMNRLESKGRRGVLGNNPFSRSGSFNRNSKIVRGGDGRGGNATYVNQGRKGFGKRTMSAFAVPNKRRKLGGKSSFFK